jgi:hypothetical protein
MYKLCNWKVNTHTKSTTEKCNAHLFVPPTPKSIFLTLTNFTYTVKTQKFRLTEEGVRLDKVVPCLIN